AADAYGLPDRIDAVWREEQLIRRVAQDDHVPAVLQLGAVEEAAAEDRDSRALGKMLARAEHDNRLRLLAPVEHAAKLRAGAAAAELDVDELDGLRLLLDRARVRHREVRPLDQLLEFTADGARDAESLDEDRIRPHRADHVAQRLVEAADHRRHAD